MELDLFSAWDEVITRLKMASNTTAIAFYNDKEQLLDANTVMRKYLGIVDLSQDTPHSLVNPSLKYLLKARPDKENRIFEGMLTIGNYTDISYVLKAQVFRKNDVICIFAEADTLTMFQENKKMSRLNQEVNNLQRQLLKEKTKLERTLNELKETQQMLIHSEKMNALGQMVAGVAHEINNPISFVTNNLYELKKYATEIFDAFYELENKIKSTDISEMISLFSDIKEKYDFDDISEDITDVISESQSGVKRVKNIVKDLRRFSRLDESERKNIDLVENIKSTLSIIKPEIDKKYIDFKIEAPESLFLDCYPGQLNQALLNILINAIYAVEEKGKIKLALYTKDKQTHILIEDNGCGISDEKINEIFNPFFTTKPVGTGTGLGLSITYKIITDLHKGTIKANSKLNKGSSFMITIPQNLEEK